MIILFDLDGTLIDSTDAILESFSIAFKKFDKDIPSDDAITSLIGLPLDIMFVKLGIKNSDVELYVDAYKEHYRVISKKKTFLLKDAKEAIIEASKIATLGVVTTKTAKYSIELLEHMQIISYFKVLIGREDVEHPKPHAQPILLALEKLNLEKQKTVMIGDTCMDMESAKSADIDSIAVLCGYGTIETLSKCTNNIVMDSLEAVNQLK